MISEKVSWTCRFLTWVIPYCVTDSYIKGEGKRFLHGDLIGTYTLSEYISDIYVNGLCIISVILNLKLVAILSAITYLLQSNARWRHWLERYVNKHHYVAVNMASHRQSRGSSDSFLLVKIQVCFRTFVCAISCDPSFSNRLF